MATKLQLITAMYDHNVKQITRTAAEWQRFLCSASRNYKLAFEEQLLVHAQRPEATAVLELEKWNTQFGRWVNKGATGIAVVDRDFPGKRRLKYYFDVSDTHASSRSRSVPLWEMKPEYELDVIDTLESTFGELAEKDTLPDAIIAAANNAVSDNMTDYLNDLLDCREDSFLEELDEHNVEVLYRNALVCSVSYMLMSRCGIEPTDYFEQEDFQAIHNFNTHDTVTLLGSATSAIAEMGIREIASTILDLQKAERSKIGTFANSKKIINNIGVTNTERSAQHENIDLQRSERIQDTRPDPAGRTGDRHHTGVWQIRVDAPSLPPEPPQGVVLPSIDERQSESTSGGDRTVSDGSDGAAVGSDSEIGGRDGETQSLRPDGVDRQNNEHPQSSGGNDTARPDLQLNLFPTPEEQIQRIEEAEGTTNAETPSAFSMSMPQENIDEALCQGSGFQYGKFRIYEQFGKSLSTKENADFLKDEYGTGGSHPAYGIGIGLDYDSKGITITHGDENKQKSTTFLNWTQTAKRIGELISADRYLNPREVSVYPTWLEHQEKVRQEAAEEAAAREILRREPTSAEPAEYRYKYHLGDSVYIGSHEYEVLSFDDSTVKLYDTKCPIINAEFSREEFDRKIRENPMNEHLRVEPDLENSDETINPELIELGSEGLEEPEPYIPQIGDRYEIQERLFEVDSVNEEWNHVSLRDITFQNGAGFPIFRRESLEFMQLFTPIREEPIQPESEELLPVGRLDFLDTNGSVAESIEYTDEDTFVKKLLEEDYYGVPFSIVVYSDENGHLVNTNRFVEDISPTRKLSFKNVQKREEKDPAVRKQESGVNYPGEIVLVKEKIPRYTASRVAYVDIIASNPPRMDMADKTHAYGIWDSETKGYLKKEDGSYIVFDLFKDADEYATKLNQDNIALIPTWEQKPKPARVNYFDAFPDVPLSQRHNYKITDDNLGHGGAKAKFRANMDAIHLLHDLELDGALATPQQQEILSRYVGWGSLPQAFDPNNGAWADEFLELQTTLGTEEYESARSTVLNAHYTSPVVIKAMYKAVENMGFRTGNILDPGCGVGNFQGLLPDSMADSKVYGIEIDPITGRIAQQLYQKNSIAIQGYEKTSLPDSFFDLAIGNVPFGSYGVIDKKYDKYKFHIHDYFFAKTLDKVRPGGVVAFVTSSWTLDKQNPAVRKYIAQRAEFLGAIRLPNNAFLANAGTQVTTDILFLQKRDRQIDLAPDSPSAEWLHLDQTPDAGNPGESIAVNAYFANHPEMILGTMGRESGTRMYGNENSTTCIPFPDRELSDLLEEAIQNIHAEITEYERMEAEQEEDNSIPADPSVRNFSYALVDGKVYFREDSRMKPQELSATAENRIKGMIGIRDCVRTLIEYQTEDYSDNDIQAEQANLNRLYDTFTKKYGLISSRANVSVFGSDSSYPLLGALEVLDEDGNLLRKADMFTKRTIRPKIEITHVDTASEALAVSLGERARVDLPYMSELTGKDEETLVKELEGVIFFNIGSAAESSKLYVTADEYLSGNVREKLSLAKAAAATFPDGRYDINVKSLEAVQPKDLSASEISVRLGATWLPPEMVQQFLFELLETPRYMQWNIKVHFLPYTAAWSIEGKSSDRGNVKAYNTYGTSRANAYKIIEETLNLKDIRIFDYIEEADGRRTPVLNKKETMLAQAKQEQIKAAFGDWIWKDPERRNLLVRMYNDKFNSVRPREYDGSHINFVGMNPAIELREHQINAVAHIMYGGNTLLAHEVGAGKTFEMVAAAMEMKRLGLCHKSMIVVPNHIIEQFAAEWLQLYPSANILVSTKKDFEPKNRRKFTARISTGDYDAVIIGHSQFEKIPMSLDFQRRTLEEQLEELLSGITEAKRNKGDNFTVKQLEKSRKSLQLRLDKLNDQSRKDDLVTFEELGVDRLFVDESHGYKNLYLYTKMRNVGGIAQTEAQKSADMFMKCRYLDELTDGRGIIFATGTPISNSMVELYSIQRYLQYETLRRNGLQHFDAWASTFGETVTAIELAPEGSGYRAKTRFAKFYNLPELMAMFREVADIQTAETLNLPVPKANFHNVVVQPSEIQLEMVEGLAERAEKVRNKMVDPSTDNMLCITNDGRKLALDQRLINSMLPDYEENKAALAAENIYMHWEEGKADGLTQLVFCDLSTPKNDGKSDGTSPLVFSSVYEDLKQKLIAKGVPAEEIAFIHDANTETKKRELFAKVRQGKIRVLMGSTFKCGSGMNVQDKIVALHRLDCPWRPSDIAQQNGRAIRQGNSNPEVNIYTYIAEKTFDAYSYQLIENKQKFISQIMTSKSPVRSAEDVDEQALSYAEIKALATGNPMIIEKCQLEMDVGRLKLIKSSFLSQRYDLEDKLLKHYPAEIKRLSERIDGYTADIATVKETFSEDGYPMKIKDTVFTPEQKKEAGTAILEACKAMTSPDPVPLGSYRRFDMELSFERFAKVYVASLKGTLTHSVEIGDSILGNITRIENVFDGMGSKMETKLQVCKDRLDDVKAQMETAKTEVEKPFPQEAELNEKMVRLNEINIALNLDERDHELVDGVPDEGDSQDQPRKKERGYER